VEEIQAEQPASFIEQVRRLVADDLRPISAQVEREERIPEAVVDKFRRLGSFGMSIFSRVPARSSGW
jgi:acyl-CoA dehydrogenase